MPDDESPDKADDGGRGDVGAVTHAAPAAPRPPAPDREMPRIGTADLAGLLSRRARLNAEMTTVAAYFADELGLDPGIDTGYLLELAEYIGRQPETSKRWWTADDLTAARQRLVEARDVIERHERLTALARERYADRLENVPDVDADGLDFHQSGAGPRLRDPSTLTAANLDEHRLFISDVERMLAQIERHVVILDGAFGSAFESAELVRLRRIAGTIVELADARPPVGRWAEAGGIESARAALQVAQQELAREAELRARVAEVFTEPIIEVDIARLHGEADGDPKALAQSLEDVTRPESFPAPEEAVTDAYDWYMTRRSLDAGTAARAALLGHFAELPIDADEASRSIDLAERLVQDLGPFINRARLRELFDSFAFTDRVLVGAARAIESEVMLFESQCSKLGYDGGSDATPAQLLGWRSAILATFGILDDVIVGLGGDESGWTVGELIEVLTFRANLESTTVEREQKTEAAEADLDDVRLAPGTDWDGLLVSMAWVDDLRQVYGGPIAPEVADRLHGVREVAGVARVRGVLNELIVTQAEIDGLSRRDVLGQ